MPHNWASAEFIRLTTYLLALDRGRELHLFEGLSPTWAEPNMETQLNAIATPFGELTLSLRVAADGDSAQLKVEALPDASCEKIVVPLGHWASRDEFQTLELNPREDHHVRIRIKR